MCTSRGPIGAFATSAAAAARAARATASASTSRAASSCSSSRAGRRSRRSCAAAIFAAPDELTAGWGAQADFTALDRERAAASAAFEALSFIHLEI
jgi:hypothetical protein